MDIAVIPQNPRMSKIPKISLLTIIYVHDLTHLLIEITASAASITACFDRPTGSFQIVDVQGGTGGYSYSV